MLNSHDLYSGSVRDLANAANEAFDKRTEAAENLAAIIRISQTHRYGWGGTKMPSDETLEAERDKYEQEVAAADQDFDAYQTMTMALLPARSAQELPTAQDEQTPQL